jgi:hypothetical protein
MSWLNGEPFWMFMLLSDSQDALNSAAVLVGSWAATPLMNGSGLSGPTSQEPGPGAATAVGTAAGPQVTPALSTPSVTMITQDGPGHGRAISSLAGGQDGADATVALGPVRAVPSPGRHGPAAISHHLLPASAPRDSNPVESIPSGPTPQPRGADLIAQALPFAGDALERSLDDFVRQLRAADLAPDARNPVVAASLVAIGAATAAIVAHEVVRRRSARGRGLRLRDPLGRELALSFPELPKSWSERRR